MPVPPIVTGGLPEPRATFKWIKSGEKISGTNVPTSPNGPANRPPELLLKNVEFLYFKLDESINRLNELTNGNLVPTNSTTILFYEDGMVYSFDDGIVFYEGNLYSANPDNAEPTGTIPGSDLTWISLNSSGTNAAGITFDNSTTQLGEVVPTEPVISVQEAIEILSLGQEQFVTKDTAQVITASKTFDSVTLTGTLSSEDSTTYSNLDRFKIDCGEY